ncbi:MAG TPA: hypothetical protein VFB66_31195 [Tepidisphaeraceae bacterium]|nr:hypothetical protein [Tepidisphaeraceae bacterium]
MSRFTLILAVTIGLFAAAASVPAHGQVNTTRRVLSRTLPEMKLTGVSFGEAVDFLRDVSGANIHVNWKALEEQNVTADTQVNLRLRSVSLRKVLNLLLSEAGGGDALAYYVDAGVIEITTKEMADKKVYTRVYPVEDLVMDVPDFVGPNMSLQSASDQAQNQGGGGGGQGLFGNDQDRRDEEDEGMTREERGEQLVELVKETIRPDIWADNGGTATIRYFRGSLVVTAPRSVHEQLGGGWD